MATKHESNPALLEKLMHGITAPASTDIERMIVHFDKLVAIRSKRPLTEVEQRTYDSLRRRVGEQFKTVIKLMQKGMNNGANQGQNQKGGGDNWGTNSVQSFWVPINGIKNFVESLFTPSPDSSPPLTIIGLLKMFGIDLDRGGEDVDTSKVDELSDKIKGSIEKLRDSFVSGISGTANASMDMVLNAFSMLPGFGTTLLIWRMFQNVLVILGSSLSMQSGTTSAITAAASAAPITGTGGTGGAKIGGGRTNNKRNNSISITAGARALHQSLKRFSGMAARMSSAVMTTTDSKSKTKRFRRWHNNSMASVMSSYALKPAAAAAAAATLLPVLPVLQLQRPHPILKPVAAA